ncbi:YdaU family protein [Kordiimonas aquimaris]|uniref:YdaU family protein n=1 Tax=Kordiimonas aquimaris TaxID=707591 RepID=UPI0021D06459|nr:DUF1376 domain-containing protein [Kordiimonas aquimaris]
MAEFPALPLFTDAYLADTRHLTTEEHGAYLLLLICAWRSRGCALKDNDKTLARIAGLSPTRWRRIKPALIDFFTVEGGLWRQKKLTSVYAGVSMRVARNKANGARGGRATSKARSQHRKASVIQAAQQTHSESTSDQAMDVAAKQIAAKTKAKTMPAAADLQDISNDFDLEMWRAAARAVCGDGVRLDDRVLHAWHDAGVDMHADMSPTVQAVMTREVARTGKPPRMLAYFRAAVLEAMYERVQDNAAARALLACEHRKIPFDPVNVDHWHQLLGDAASRFRGDYMAQHWFIDRDHPVFLPAELGPNPRLSCTSHIPAEIYSAYAASWGWLRADI